MLHKGQHMPNDHPTFNPNYPRPPKQWRQRGNYHHKFHPHNSLYADFQRADGYRWMGYNPNSTHNPIIGLPGEKNGNREHMSHIEIITHTEHTNQETNYCPIMSSPLILITKKMFPIK